MRPLVTLVKRLLCVALVVSILLLVLTQVILYFGYEWQPSSYKGNFARIFSEPIYKKLMVDLDRSDQSILLGSSADGFDYFMKEYITRTKGEEKIKLRYPVIRENLELHTNQYLSKVYNKIVSVIYWDQGKKEEKTSLWVIDVRGYNVSAEFLKSFQGLRKKYRSDRFIVLGELEDSVNIKGFKRLVYETPTEDEIRNVIQQSEGNIAGVHVDNLFWYYTDQIDRIAEIIDKYEVESFFQQFREEDREYEYIHQGHEELLGKICQSGSYESEELKDLRLSRVVGYEEGRYYWSSPEALLVYSGNKEMECEKTEKYVGLSEQDRERISQEIDQEIRQEEERAREQSQRLEMEKSREEQMSKKQNKEKKEKKSKKEKKPTKSKDKSQKDAEQNPDEPQEVEQVPVKKAESNKKKQKQQSKSKPSQKLQARRSKKSIDDEQDEDIGRDDASNSVDDLQADLLIEYAEEDDDEDTAEVGEQLIKRRIRLAQKKTKKQEREQLQDLQNRLKRIKSMKKGERRQRVRN